MKGTLMMKLLLIGFLTILLVAIQASIARAQGSRKTACKIPWQFVRSTSFRVWWDHSEHDCQSYRLVIDKGVKRIKILTKSGITDNYDEIRDLQPSTNYGVKVMCVNDLGHNIAVTKPCRTKTKKQIATTKPIVATTIPPPVGPCGVGYFTCEGNSSECLTQDAWCDREKECQDGSDEKNCPGHCSAITKFHEAGNFSCSYFNSPMSACFFDCDPEWVRVGAYYTVCENGKWTREVPKCVLEAPEIAAVIDDASKKNEVYILFSGLRDASDYVLVSVIDESGDVVEGALFSYVATEEGNLGTLAGLNPGGTYSFSIAAVDKSGVKGKTSVATTAKTASESEISQTTN